MQNTDITITFIQTIATLYAFFFAVYALGIKKHANNSPYHSYFYAISLTVIIAFFFYALMLFIYFQEANFLLLYTNEPIFKYLLEFVKSTNLNYFNAAYSVFIFTIGLMFIYAKILLDFYKEGENQSQKIKNNHFLEDKLKVVFKSAYNLLNEIFSKMGMYGNLILIIMVIFLLLQFPEISLFELIMFIPLFYLAICVITLLVVISLFSVLSMVPHIISLLERVKKSFMKN